MRISLRRTAKVTTFLRAPTRIFAGISARSDVYCRRHFFTFRLVFPLKFLRILACGLRRVFFTRLTQFAVAVTRMKSQNLHLPLACIRSMKCFVA